MLESVCLGDWSITALRDARFALDGGAMFGVVPRSIWETLTPVNSDNTIPLATIPFLLEKEDKVIVVEPGLGHRWNSRQRAMFHLDHSGGHDLIESLANAGRHPDEVTHCLMTHGHWDHIGAACDVSGNPVFQNAEHWIPEIERGATMNPDHLRRASYRREDLQPIEKRGLLRTFHDEVEILPNLKLVSLGGHSDGVSVVLLEDAGETACFWSDVVPTRNHVHRPFIMAYDMNAALSFEVRGPWIERAANESWLCLLYHDPVYPFGRFVSSEGGKFDFEPIQAEKRVF